MHALHLNYLSAARSSFDVLRKLMTGKKHLSNSSMLIELGFAFTRKFANSEGAAKGETCAHLASELGVSNAKVNWLIAETLVCMKDEKATQKLLDVALLFAKTDDQDSINNKTQVLERLMVLAHGNDQLLRTIRPALIKLAPQLLSKTSHN